MPKFNNRENKRIELPSGDLFFHARSTAVVACVICMVGDVPHVLMVERGEKVDNSGLWCLPCGYLDWDESLGEAVVRELFEETGLDIGEIPQERIIHRDENVPYYIESSPKAHRQNISHHFGIALRGPLPALNAKAAIESGEIQQAEWVKMSAIPTNAEIRQDALNLEGMFAFDHNERAHRFVSFLKERGIINVQ